ncbi:MAG: M20/M25/M40 family metallo-hydrolase, partial [Clostridia bacterium]|nr:M20/M25/M40 family metallo-hydrolase [Clostridia bacterium]
VSPTVVEMLYRFSLKMKGVKKTVFKNSEVLKNILKKAMPKFSDTANALLKTTVCFTMASGSKSFNVIPGEAYVIGDMRFSHHQGSESSLSAVKQIADKYGIETEVIDEGISSGITDYRSEPFRLMEKAIKSTFNDAIATPYISNTAADVRFMSRVSDCCMRFVPFFIDDKQYEGIHGVNENVDIKTLVKAVDFYKYLMERS